MNNRHRRIARLKAQEQKRMKTNELMKRFYAEFTKEFTVIWEALVDVVDSISRGIDEALHK